jgi:hypothetical protein
LILINKKEKNSLFIFIMFILHIQLTQILAGDVIPQRKKYQDAASRVLHLVQNYGNCHVLDFLRGVAYNIHM